MRGRREPDLIHVVNLERCAVPRFRYGIRSIGRRGVLVAACALICASSWKEAPGAINKYLSPPGDLADVQAIGVRQYSRSSLYAQNTMSLVLPAQALSSKAEISLYRRVRKIANSQRWIDRNKAGEVDWDVKFAALFNMFVAKE